jgi:hypothetical protein
MNTMSVCLTGSFDYAQEKRQIAGESAKVFPQS